MENDTKYTLKVKDGPLNDEYIITRHSQFSPPINIINVYGEQENRTHNTDIEERWNRILTELMKIEYTGESVILLGDLNKHVGKVIEGNNEKISFGGNLILELLKSNKYSLVNSTNKVKGGPFTRYNPAAPDDDKSKSCLELVIISRSLLKNVKELIIDKDFKFTPGRPISKTKMVYPDHYAILLVMKNLPLSSNKSRVCQKYQMWNINKEGGWKKYRELTENNEIPEDF